MTTKTLTEEQFFAAFSAFQPAMQKRIFARAGGLLCTMPLVFFVIIIVYCSITLVKTMDFSPSLSDATHIDFQGSSYGRLSIWRSYG